MTSQHLAVFQNRTTRNPISRKTPLQKELDLRQVEFASLWDEKISAKTWKVGTQILKESTAVFFASWHVKKFLRVSLGGQTWLRGFNSLETD